MKGLARVVSTREIAKQTGMSVNGARRWLLRLEAEYGPGLVWRVGHRLATTTKALSRIDPSWVDECETREESIRPELEQIGERMVGLERSLRSLGARVRALEHARPGATGNVTRA